MPAIHNTLARVFFDVHYNASSRPVLNGGDKYIDMPSTGLMNEDLVPFGWSTIPSNLRAGWASRSAKTEQDSSSGNLIDYVVLSDGSHIGALNSFGIIKSINGGQSFYNVLGFTNSLRSGLIIAHHPDGTVAVCTSTLNNLYVSKDFGDSWTTYSYSSFPVDAGCITIDPNDSNIIVIGGRNGTASRIIKSIDGGITFSVVMEELGTQHLVNSIIHSDSNLLVATSWNTSNSNLKTYKSIDGGETWTIHNTAITLRTFSLLNLENGSFLICGYSSAVASFGAVTFNTTSNVSTLLFTPSQLGVPHRMYKHENRIYVAASITGEYAAYWYSDNNGSSWNSVSKQSEHGGTARALYYDHTTDFIAIRGITPANYYISSSVASYSLRIGIDDSRRLGYFYAGYDSNTFTPIAIDLTQKSIVELSFNLKEYPTLATYFQYFTVFFVDNTGKPISVSANIGAGTQNYIGWALEMKLIGANIMVARRIVGIRGFPALSTASDTRVPTVDTLLQANADFQITLGRFMNVRLIKEQLVMQFNVYSETNGDLNYSNLISRTLTDAPQSVIDFIFGNRVTYGIIGNGGSGSTSRAGKISNYSMKVL